MTILAVCYSLALIALLVGADFGALRPIHDFVHAFGELDKVIHFLLYGGLALVVNSALLRPSRGLPARSIVTGTIFVLIAATFEEYSNMLVPCRGWSLGDLVANYLGILAIGVAPFICLRCEWIAAHLNIGTADTTGLGEAVSTRE